MMTQELEEKALEGVDGFFTKLTEAADIVTAKLIEVTPDAAEAILNLVQFKGIFTIVSSLPFVILIPIVAWHLFFRLHKWIQDEPGYYDRGVAYVPAAFVSIPVGLIWAAFVVDFISFYNWLSALYPEGAIALKALEAVGINL